MAQSDRSPPERPPKRGSSKAKGEPRRSAGRPPASQKTDPAPRVRLKKQGKAAAGPAAPSSEPSPDIKVHRDPAWKRAWDWLMEDPAKTESEGPSEREKALARVEEADRAARRAYLRAKIGLKEDGEALAAEGEDPPAEAAGKPAAKRGPSRRKAKQEATKQESPSRKLVAAPLALWHKLLGEDHHQDETGGTIVVPPRESDWRWKVHHFFRSQVRWIAYSRALVLTLLVLSSAWVAVFSTTGVDYTELLLPEDPEDARTKHRLPFFIIESGSMMHPDAPWGRIGTVDPGDIVIIERYKPGMDIETFYGRGDKEVAGAKGDVLMYLPVEYTANQEVVPTIHRAMAYIQYDPLSVPNPDFPARSNQRFITEHRYTVEEFGIVNAPAITIPELGLENYGPRMSGYVTRGDNPRSNNWADQALGVTPLPVPKDRILGLMKAEVPVIGLAKIALSGQDPRSLSTDDQWCSFLAGKAACDTWVLFFIVTLVTVGGPLVFTIVVFGGRWWRRRIDRLAAAERARSEEASSEAAKDDAPPELVVHDAVDLLSGKVRPDGVPHRGVRPWRGPGGSGGGL